MCQLPRSSRHRVRCDGGGTAAAECCKPPADGPNIHAEELRYLVGSVSLHDTLEGQPTPMLQLFGRAATAHPVKLPRLFRADITCLTRYRGRALKAVAT